MGIIREFLVIPLSLGHIYRIWTFKSMNTGLVVMAIYMYNIVKTNKL